jgi:sensor histidine kinase YesM
LDKKISISLYWKCQLIGWSVASLYWSYLGFSGGKFNLPIGLLEFISDVIVYILITHLYRNFAIKHNWQHLNINPLIKRIIPAIIIMGIAYLTATIVKVYLFHLWLSGGNTVSFSTFFKLNWSVMFVAGIRLMSIWLLAYHLYHYALREINTARENARLSIMAKDAQLNNLSAQLNPHFLFNSLNNIKALVIENPKSARRAIDLLSDLLRNALYNKEAGTTTLKEELNLVKDYLELEKLRLEERLQFTINADDNLNNFLIPRFCIQTLAENAIKHGIDKQKQGGLIDIRASCSDNLVCISINNPGKFDVKQNTEGLGISNLTQRLQLQYNGRASFNIINEDKKTVLSTITIPRV